MVDVRDVVVVVGIAKGRRYELRHRFIDQRAGIVPKNYFGLPVGEDDVPTGVDQQ